MTLSCVKNTAFDSAFKQYSTLEGILQILQKHSFFIHIYILYCLKEMLHSKYRTLQEILHLYGVLS